MARSHFPIPTEQHPLLDDDLWFAAAMHADFPGQLRALRDSGIKALKQLKRRWISVGEHLRTFQTAAIRQVTIARDLGLTALLIVVLSWPDVTYPYGLITGLPAVGTAPPYGVFPQQPGLRLTLDDVLVDWEARNAAIMATLNPGKHDDSLLEQSIADAHKGFCAFPLTRGELLSQLQGQPHRLIPRCIIVQPSGKKRIIDNGDTGGQSELSFDWNKLVLCSPLRPAQLGTAASSVAYTVAYTQYCTQYRNCCICCSLHRLHARLHTV